MDTTDAHEPTTTHDVPAKTLDEPTTRLGERRRPESAPPVAARPPLRSTSLAILGLVWAAVLTSAGAVGIHDALAASEVVDDPWIPRAIAYVDGIQPDEDVLIAAGVGGLIGIALVVLALWPRHRRKIVLRSPAGVYVRQRHVERLLGGRMETLDGVLRCSAEVRGRRVTLDTRGVAGVDPAKLYGGVVARARDELGLLPRRRDIQLLVREAD